MSEIVCFVCNKRVWHLHNHLSTKHPKEYETFKQFLEIKPTSYLIRQLTEEEKQIILGMLLGSGELWQRGRRIYLETFDSGKHLFFLNWLACKLRRLAGRVVQHNIFLENYGRIYTLHHFITDSLHRTDLSSLSKETNSLDIIFEQLDDLGLAVWYMDAGSLTGEGACIRLSFPSNKKPLNSLRNPLEYFNIHGCELTKDEDGWKLLLTKESSEELFNIIAKHVLREFTYKLKHLEVLTVTKRFHFDAAHFLEDYQGKCIRQHGGRYYLEVTVERPVDEESGMVIDFNEIEKIVDENVIEKFDHRVINFVHEKLRYNATTENLVRVIRDILLNKIPGLKKVRVYESPDSWAEWSG